MPTTTIPWGDGSGDNLYLTYPSASGDQSVSVTSDANTGAARSKVVTFSASGVPSVSLTISQASALPYTPLEYLETDGVAYINTGIRGTPPKSSEIKVMIPTDSTSYCGILCAYTIASSYNARNFALLKFRNGYATFAYYYNYSGGDGTPSISWSITNQKPFIVKTNIRKGAQTISVKQEDSDSWTSLSKSQNGAVSSTYELIIFNGYQNNSYSIPAPSGTRLYYCKIYSDDTYTNLVFDGVPCIYNGEYGLWDRVTDSFFGNAAGTGAFTGA